MRVWYTPRAFAERERIFSYLEARNPQAARRVERRAPLHSRFKGSNNVYDAANVVGDCGRLSFGRVQVTDAGIQEQDATTI